MLWRPLWSRETNPRCRVGPATIPGKSFDYQQQRITLRHQLDCSSCLHTIWCPNGVVTRADPTAEDTQKDALLPSAFSALMRLTCFSALIHQTFCTHGATALRNLRPTRSSYGVFPSSPGRNQLIVTAACVTSHAKLS